LFVISSSCSVWNYKIPTRTANFVDSPNASSRSVMFLITSPKNECTLASQLEKGAGLLALAEGKQEIAHAFIGGGEVDEEVGAIGFLAGEALANVQRFITIAANRAQTGIRAAESQSLRTYELDLDGGKPQPLGPDDFTGYDAALT
jgi:hypothetical protein